MSGTRVWESVKKFQETGSPFDQIEVVEKSIESSSQVITKTKENETSVLYSFSGR